MPRETQVRTTDGETQGYFKRMKNSEINALLTPREVEWQNSAELILVNNRTQRANANHQTSTAGFGVNVRDNEHHNARQNEEATVPVAPLQKRLDFVETQRTQNQQIQKLLAQQQ